MAFIQIDDGTSSLEVSVFNELFEEERSRIRIDEILIIEGKVRRDDFAGEGQVRVSADRLLTLAEARARFARHLRLSLGTQKPTDTARLAHHLHTLLSPFTPGHCPVLVSYRNGSATCQLLLGEGSRVRLEDELLFALRNWLGTDNVSIEYP